MERDIENLNLELIQAQILLRASHDLFKDIMLEVTRRKIYDTAEDLNNVDREIRERVAKFSSRDEEIRRMLARLDKLGNSGKQVA